MGKLPQPHLASSSLNALSHKSFLPSFPSEVHLCAFLNVSQSLSRAVCPRQWGWFNWNPRPVATGRMHAEPNSTCVGAGKQTHWAPGVTVDCCRVAGSVHGCSPLALLSPLSPQYYCTEFCCPEAPYCFLGLLRAVQYVGNLFQIIALFKTIFQKNDFLAVPT